VMRYWPEGRAERSAWVKVMSQASAVPPFIALLRCQLDHNPA
jgi:hypothetical protein